MQPPLKQTPPLTDAFRSLTETFLSQAAELTTVPVENLTAVNAAFGEQLEALRAQAKLPGERVYAALLAAGMNDCVTIFPVARAEGAAGLAALASALRSDNLLVAVRAARTLVLYGKAAKPALPELIEAVGSENPFLAEAAVDAIAAIGREARPAVEALIGALKHHSFGVYEPAAEALGNLAEGNPAVMAALIKMLGRKDDPARIAAAARGLRAMGPAAIPAIPALAAALSGLRGLCLHNGRVVVDTIASFGVAARTALPALRRYRNLHLADDLHTDKAIARIEESCRGFRGKMLVVWDWVRRVRSFLLLQSSALSPASPRDDRSQS